MEGDLVGVPVDPEWVVPARRVQEKDVQSRHRGDQEWDEKVEGKEPGQRRVVHCKPPPKPGDQARPEVGKGGE